MQKSIDKFVGFVERYIDVFSTLKFVIELLYLIVKVTANNKKVK